MKRLLVVAVAVALSGCIAHMTPYGISIEPMTDFYLIGPPVVVAPPGPGPGPGHPLPPVVVVPDRSVYFYNDLFYYFWGENWYWGRAQGGPWHPLGREYWPSHLERRDHDRGDRRRDGGPGPR